MHAGWRCVGLTGMSHALVLECTFPLPSHTLIMCVSITFSHFNHVRFHYGFTLALLRVSITVSHSPNVFHYGLTPSHTIHAHISIVQHAMVFTGYDRAPDAKRPSKWRVENSWGTFTFGVKQLIYFLLLHVESAIRKPTITKKTLCTPAYD